MSDTSSPAADSTVVDFEWEGFYWILCNPGNYDFIIRGDGPLRVLHVDAAMVDPVYIMVECQEGDVLYVPQAQSATVHYVGRGPAFIISGGG